MKKFFVFKNGQIIGSQIGYTTYKGALKSLIGTNDWYEQLLPYENHNAKTEISKELENTGFYKRSIDDTCWLFIRSKWLKKIWYPFVKENYQIIEKEYKIIFLVYHIHIKDSFHKTDYINKKIVKCNAK